jgi:hypothetical protein
MRRAVCSTYEVKDEDVEYAPCIQRRDDCCTAEDDNCCLVHKKDEECCLWLM